MYQYSLVRRAYLATKLIAQEAKNENNEFL